MYTDGALFRLLLDLLYEGFEGEEVRVAGMRDSFKDCRGLRKGGLGKAVPEELFEINGGNGGRSIEAHGRRLGGWDGFLTR